MSALEKNDYLIRPNENNKENFETIKTVLIISPHHTFFLANTIKKVLLESGFLVELSDNYNESSDEYDLYFVLRAQKYNILPPSEKTIIFQLEQYISSKEFNNKYPSVLRTFENIVDYNIENISFLTKIEVKSENIYYLPVSANFDFLVSQTTEKEYDFLFYGDLGKFNRRKGFLDVLSQKYRVKICTEVFGDDLYKFIKKSHCVINIHYYENALLETPRIFESISLGVPVLSEFSDDHFHYPELDNVVCYFKENSIDDMLTQAEFILNNIDRFRESIHNVVASSESHFKYMLNRALAGFGFINKKILLDEPIYIECTRDAIVLSLPESEHRRVSCLKDSNKLPTFEFFDGIRFKPGWQACGYSYKALAQHLLKKGLNMATIFEDDAYLQSEDLSDYDFVKNYLKARQKPWDVFSGIIADLHKDAKILDIEEWNGRKFVTITHMTSTVFNIYSKSGLKLLANWPSDNEDVNANTIDRYLESVNDIKVVTTIPFIAGHKEDLDSTLWGTNNAVYNEMIARSENAMESLIKSYEKSTRL